MKQRIQVEKNGYIRWTGRISWGLMAAWLLWFCWTFDAGKANGFERMNGKRGCSGRKKFCCSLFLKRTIFAQRGSSLKTAVSAKTSGLLWAKNRMPGTGERISSRTSPSQESVITASRSPFLTC